ncbi:MAG: serine/threonine-protein phosphatase [candidate division Zixibacteria bacterium]|nr:serine/threonine-protein phosphatase [candidate division Zixibacteria bacterium]
MSSLPKLRVVGKTDRGLVRPGNEDYIHLDEANLVFAVCDGMGGHQAGEIASMTAAETLRAVFSAFAREILEDPRLALGRTLPYSADLLVKGVRLANRSVGLQAAANAELSGMGTTIVAVSFEADIAAIAHVGDSRAYRLSEQALEPLTSDHSWVAEMQKTHQLSESEANSLVGRNVITRALGVRETVEVDLCVTKVKVGDILLMCSDGLCGYADDDEIFRVARRSIQNIEQLADDLVQMANDRGGADNVSVIAIEVLAVSPSPLPEVAPITFPVETPEQLAAEVEWLGKFAAERLAPEKEPGDPPKPKAKGWLLFSILAALIVVSVLIFILVTK